MLFSVKFIISIYYGLLFPIDTSSTIFNSVFSTLEKLNLTPFNFLTYSPPVLPEAILTTSEIIARYGFVYETHTINTSDGYIIDIHRIPSQFKSNKVPVLMQHGVQCSSGAWVINGLENSLGFVLAKNGFDVWLSNIRGNRYGRKHVTLDPDDKEFWKFNIDHFALIDLPTTIDHVLSVTGHSKLAYLGHSMGSTMILALLSDKPQYNDKIHLAILQAPVYFERYVRSPLRLLGVFLEDVANIWKLLSRTDEFLGSSLWQRHIIQKICTSYPGILMCESFFYVIFGYDEILNNRERIHVFLSHCPSGTSFQVFLHFGQIFRNYYFKHFNYDKSQNQKLYNQDFPPEYDLSRVRAPTAIFWAYMDPLTDQQDVLQLAKRLPNLQLVERVPFDLFAHQDFQFSFNTTFHHYHRVLELLLTFKEETALNTV